MSLSSNIAAQPSQRVTTHNKVTKAGAPEQDTYQSDRALMDQIVVSRAISLQMCLRVMGVVAATTVEERENATSEFSGYLATYMGMLDLLFGTSNDLGLPTEKLAWIREIATQDRDFRKRFEDCGARATEMGRRLSANEIPTFAEANEFYEKLFPATIECANLIIEALWADIDQNKGDIESSRRSLASAVSEIRKISTSVRLTALNASVEAARAGDAGRGFSVIAGEVKTLAEDIQIATDKAENVISTLMN
jgi:hypothetical protein